MTEAVRPKIRAAVARVLDLIEATPALDHCDMTEIFGRSIVSVALDLVDGDNVKAGKYLKEVAMPFLADMSEQLQSRGGKTEPEGAGDRRAH